jgi:hypothetical protein
MGSRSITSSSRVDRTALAVQSLDDTPDDREYWWSRSPVERLAAIEIMRRVVYGRAASHGGLQRVLEITQREPR